MKGIVLAGGMVSDYIHSPKRSQNKFFKFVEADDLLSILGIDG